MKKNLFFILLSFVTFCMYGQAYRGFHTDNYSGVHGMLSNPTFITGNKLKYDVNLASFDVLLSNNYLSVDFSNLDSFDPLSNSNPNSSLVIDTQVLGPSFFFKLNPKSAIGVFTKARLMGNVTDLNQDLMNVFINGFDDQTTNININNSNINLIQNTWAEIGLTYARDIVKNQKSKFKGGLSVKYLMGASANYSKSENFTFAYNDGSEIINMGGTFTTAVNNDIIGGNASLSDVLDNLGTSSGIGGDLGFSYEFQDKKTFEDDYKFRIGASVLDIGKINYEMEREVYTLNPLTNITVDEFEKIGSDLTISEFMAANYGAPTIEKVKTKVNLPTRLNLNADFKFTRHLYINATSNIALTKTTGSSIQSRTLTHHTLTPRFESKLFGLWSPVGIDEFENFTWGAGLRFGPIFVGSGSVLSSLLDDTKIADVYFGLKLPIIQKTRQNKDIDNDGVLNDEDKCPTIVGTIENNGCPEEKQSELPFVPTELDKDTDGDGVFDSQDKCVDVPGTILNNGCPEDKKTEPKSTDKDSDGDSVLDSVDACPEVKGTVENKGCPVTVKEIETFRQNVREVYFDSAKSNVNESSAAKLLEASVVMKKFPEMYWIVEGHSDSSGPDLLNQTLSEARALSVKNFFIQNGIKENQIKSVGYGETRPQTTNLTLAGREKNRRVEIRPADKNWNLVGMDLPKEQILEEISNLIKFVYFETGSGNILANSKAQLDLIAYYMKQDGGSFEIEGHTDNVGNDDLNQKLSELRANSVKSYLISKGINGQNLIAIGYGERLPKADNRSKDGQAENRRIEIKKKHIHNNN